MTEKTTLRPTGQSGKNLRTLLEDRPITIMGAPFPLAAREIERQGFPAVYLSGAALSAGLLGIPDIGLIPFEILEQQTFQLAKTVTIPVIVDADTGFGDCKKTISTFENKGLAGCHIEDQIAEKRCGHLDNKKLIAKEEKVKKMTSHNLIKPILLILFLLSFYLQNIMFSGNLLLMLYQINILNLD